MHDRHPSKAKWSARELRVLRELLERKHGNGPRAQSRIVADMAAIRTATTDERVAWRRKYPTLARGAS